MKVGENMCQITLNSHAKFHGDRIHRWRYNIQNSSQKHYICIENDLTLLSMFIIHIKHYFFILLIGLLILSNFASGINAVNQIVH